MLPAAGRRRFAGILRRVTVLCALLFLLQGVATNGQDPTPRETRTEVFTGAGEAPRAVERPSIPTTAYWRVEAYVRLPNADLGSRVEMFLPLSDGRQRILSRGLLGDGWSFREDGVASNLRGVWVYSGAPGSAEVQYEVTAEISDAEVSVPRRPKGEASRGAGESLAPTALIQSDDPEIRRRAREITAETTTSDAAAWALFQYTTALPHESASEPATDAKSVLERQQGNTTGKARLLAAMLRSLKIPARVVGGLRLEDAKKKRATISWLEAKLGASWVPIDPGANHFGWLPHDYLALYRGDLPLIVHPSGIQVEYGFVIRQITREAALGIEGSAPGAPGPRIETRVGTQQVRTLTSYQEKPVASVLLLVDQSIPESISDRIVKEARSDQVNLVIMQARFESRYFREQHLQRLVSNNLSLVSGAHLVLIAMGDDAGLYALFALGERGIKMGDARVIIAGEFPRSVGEVLGAVQQRLLDTGEIVLVDRPVGLLGLWETARANLLRGVPMAEEGHKWDIRPFVVNSATMRELSWWRKRIVGAWARAVRAQVPLQALNLILMLPIIATIIVVARVLIGIDSFGTFAPVIVSLAFLTTGLQWGVIIFVVIVSCGVVVRTLLQRLRLQMVSRLAILIATVAGLMAGLTVAGASFGIGALINISIFPMIIMSSVIENFAISQFEFGTREATRLTLNTLLLSSLCYLSIDLTGLQSLVLAFPGADRRCDRFGHRAGEVARVAPARVSAVFGSNEKLGEQMKLLRGLRRVRAEVLGMNRRNLEIQLRYNRGPLRHCRPQAAHQGGVDGGRPAGAGDLLRLHSAERACTAGSGDGAPRGVRAQAGAGSGRGWRRGDCRTRRGGVPHGERSTGEREGSDGTGRGHRRGSLRPEPGAR